MKPVPLGRLGLSITLLCLTLSACTASPSDPTDRYNSMQPGMSREQVERYYGPPTHWVLYYEPTGFAVFSYDKLLSYSKLDNTRQKPDWPVQEGMSVSEVQKIMGNPSKACAGEYFTESFAHWFCYKNDRLISKERRPPPFS
jgi:hypothetical protein